VKECKAMQKSSEPIIPEPKKKRNALQLIEEEKRARRKKRKHASKKTEHKGKSLTKTRTQLFQSRG